MPEELQPMTVVRIAIRSFSLYFRMFGTLASLGLVLSTIPLIVMLVGSGIAGGGNEALGLMIVVVGFVLFLVSLFYFYAATTLAVSLRATGAKAGVWQILGRLRGDLIRQIIGTGFLSAFAIAGGLLLLIIPGLVLLVRFLFVQPVVVLERTAYRAALRRSRELTRGYGWRIFGALLIYELFIIIAASIAGFIVGVVLGLAGHSASEAEEAVRVTGDLISLFFYPVGLIFPVLLYYDIRVRKEALNLETIREVV